MSIQAGAVLAGAFALGRFLSGFFLKIQLDYVVSFCVVGFAISLLLVLPLTHSAAINSNTTWMNAPLVVYLFPLMGGLLAPIYPSINSVIRHQSQNICTVLCLDLSLFSAIGGTIGSVITGFVFQEFSGQRAFYLSLIPLTLLIISAIL